MTRVIIFIPAVVSLTAIGLLWVIAYNPSIGFVNPVLEKIGLGAIAHDWLGDSKTERAYPAIYMKKLLSMAPMVSRLFSRLRSR